MLWEHEPQVSSFRKHRHEKKENSLFTLIIQMLILFHSFFEFSQTFTSES